MARAKPARPVERPPSSEYVTRQDGTPRRQQQQQQPNGRAAAAAPSSPPPKDAGMAQLAVAVAGIYASL